MHWCNVKTLVTIKKIVIRAVKARDKRSTVFGRFESTFKGFTHHISIFLGSVSEMQTKTVSKHIDFKKTFLFIAKLMHWLK